MGEDNPVWRTFDGKRDRETTTLVLSYTEWKVEKKDDTGPGHKEGHDVSIMIWAWFFGFREVGFVWDVEGPR